MPSSFPGLLDATVVSAAGAGVRVSQALSLRDAAVARFLAPAQSDFVLGEYLDEFVDFVPLLHRMRIPYVVQGHGIDLSAGLRQPKAAERYLIYRSARAVLTRCEFHRQRLIRLGLPPDIIHVNPGGVDVPDQPPSRRSDACKRFLAIGRFVPKKGPIYLLEAFRLAATRDPKITLDYIGGGELLPAAQQFVKVCRLEERVRLHGPAPERRQITGSFASVAYSSSIALPTRNRR